MAKLKSAGHDVLDVLDYGADGAYLMSKGWHDPAEFKAQAQERELAIDRCGEPQHVWLRCVPDSTGEYAYQYRVAVGGSKGAFAATLAIEGGCEPR